jgi:hypothetical protein
MWSSAKNNRRILLLLSALLAFCMWFYVDRVWGPPTEIHYSDLYPRWYGSRELLLHDRDPYGPEVSREIQMWSYGRVVAPGEQKDEDRFAYPLYVVFLLAPTVRLPFPQVVRLFRWILPIAALISVPLWVYMLRWRCSRPLLGSLTLLSFGSFQVLESIYLQQPVLVAAAFLAGAGASLAAGRLGLAGVLLAFSTFKPQLTALLVPWLLLWAVSEWRSRQALVWGFGITMLGLIVASEILLPGWIREFLAGVVAYQRYTGNFSIFRLFLGRVGSGAVSSALAAGLAVVSWKLRRAPVSSRGFMVVFCLVLVVTVVVIPTLYPTNQVVLLPAIFLLLRESEMIWQRGRAVRLAAFASACLIAWPWLGALILMLARAFKAQAAIRRLWLFPVSSILLVPLSLLVVFAMLAPVLFEWSRAGQRSAAIVHTGAR